MHDTVNSESMVMKQKHFRQRDGFTRGTRGRVETRNSAFRMLKHFTERFSLCKASVPPSHQTNSKVKPPTGTQVIGGVGEPSRAT